MGTVESACGLPTHDRLLDLTPTDLEALQRLRPWMEAHLPEIGDEFCTRLLAFEEVRRGLADADELARVKALQSDCLVSLTAGVSNQTYLANRRALDQAYARAGLSPHCYIAAWGELLRNLVPRILREHRPRPVVGASIVSALITVAHLDMQLAVQAHLNHRRQEVEEASRALSHRATALEEKVRALEMRSRVGSDASRDLDPGKVFEQTLTASETQYRSLVENTPLLIFRLDLQGRCTFVNKAIESLLGWLAGALIEASRVRDLIGHPDDWPEAALAKALAGEVLQGVECRLRQRDGVWRWCMLTLYPQRDRDEQIIGVEGIAQDITERKRATLEMMRSERLALAGQLASGLAHEVGTPLNVITGTAEYLLADLPPDDPRRIDLELIDQETHHVADLVRRLLGLVRDSREPRTSVEVHDLLDHTLRLLAYRFEKEKIAVVKQYAPRLPPIVGVRQQLEQVFLNILVNAWHAMPLGGMIRVTTQADRRRVIVRIADTGCGIPEEHLGRLFEPFFTTKPPEQGTGLGLPVAHHLITAHGGHIEVASQVQRGTTVTIVLPRTSGEQNG